MRSFVGYISEGAVFDVRSSEYTSKHHALCAERISTDNGLLSFQQTQLSALGQTQEPR